MSEQRLEEWRHQVAVSLSEGVATKVLIGMQLCLMREVLGDEFPRWCAQACGLPLAEAELLMRWAVERSEWSDPASVDFGDPMAGELLLLGVGRSLGVDLAGAATTD
jgi:hypothetical protein